MAKDDIMFDIVKIEDAIKAGHKVVTVKYKETQREYTFVRKSYFKAKGARRLGLVIVEGCEVYFDPITYEPINVERAYETKGVKRKDTSVSESIKEEIKEKRIVTPKVPEIIEIPDGDARHKEYDTIKTCLMAGIPVYLAGPAGAGKNFTVEQIAEELGWNFYFANSVQQEYKLTGFVDAGGKYHETEFYKACTDEKDCIFFLDEMDASIPEVLVLLNAAIANGYFEFPTGKVNLKNVHFVSAGNTVGTGADDMYTGRMVLDQATLDRFAIIEFDYDKNIELKIAKGNLDLVNFVRDLREVASNGGVRATFSYRCIKAVTELEAMNTLTLEKIIKITVVKGMDTDSVRTLRVTGNSKYHKALGKLQAA